VGAGAVASYASDHKVFSGCCVTVHRKGGKVVWQMFTVLDVTSRSIIHRLVVHLEETGSICVRYIKHRQMYSCIII